MLSEQTIHVLIGLLSQVRIDPLASGAEEQLRAVKTAAKELKELAVTPRPEEEEEEGEDI